MEPKHQTSASASQEWWHRLVVVVATFLSFVYLLQLASPLRLNTDSMVFLSIGASVADGHGFLLHGHVTHFPPGYPAMLAFLDCLGLASSWSFIFLNCAFLGATLTAGYLLYRNLFGLTTSTSIALCCAVMLSFVLVKHMTIPLSDVPFMGLFTLALLLLGRTQDGSDRMRWSCFLCAFLLAGLATTVRTAGVALLPAFAWVVGQSFLTNLHSSRRGRTILLRSCLAGIIIVALSCAFLISTTRYFQEMKAQYLQTGLVTRLQNNMVVHIKELGEVGVNAPYAKAPSVSKPAFTLVGILMIALVFRGIWLRRRSFGVLEVAILAYGGMVFIWPYPDARFWLPVLPLIAGFVALAMIDAASHRYFRIVGPVMCAWFTLAGLVAMAYSTRISWAGKRFPDLYGDGTLTPSYRAAFLGQTNVMVNSDAVILLKRYEPRAQKASPRDETN